MTRQQDQGQVPRPGVSPVPKASPRNRCRLPSPKPRAYWGPEVLPTASMTSPPCDPEVLASRDHFNACAS